MSLSSWWNNGPKGDARESKLPDGKHCFAEGWVWVSKGVETQIVDGIYDGVTFKNGEVFLPPTEKAFINMSYPDELKMRGIS